MTKLSLMVHHHEPECLMKRFYGCIEGEGHSKCSWVQWMFIWITHSELLLWNLSLWIFMWWCIIISWSVMQKHQLICNLEGQGHWEGLCNQNMTFYVISTELLNEVKCKQIGHTMTITFDSQYYHSAHNGGYFAAQGENPCYFSIGDWVLMLVVYICRLYQND